MTQILWPDGAVPTDPAASEEAMYLRAASRAVSSLAQNNGGTVANVGSANSRAYFRALVETLDGGSD